MAVAVGFSSGWSASASRVWVATSGPGWRPAPAGLPPQTLRRTLRHLSAPRLRVGAAASTSSSIDEAPPHHTSALPERPGTPARLLSDVLIAATVGVFAAQLLFPEVTLLGVKSNELLEAGQWWRLVTPIFLHGSIPHLALNMLSLHQLGPVTEWTCGRQRFAAVYLVAGVAGNAMSYYGDPHPSLGASGAIFGLAGALAVYFARNRPLFGSRFDDLLRRLALIILLNLGSGLVLPQIDQWGHLGGLLGGGAVAYLLGPRYELCRVRGRRGVWLVDDPPLEALATPPRKVLD